jgi:COP9 signalosome complex subunit 5
MQGFLAANNIVIDDSTFYYDDEEVQKYLVSGIWKTDLHYFSKIKINALALMKMVTHAMKGGDFEIMGNLVGRIHHRTLIVMDCIPLPVVGTETRVSAGNDALAYVSTYTDLKANSGNLFCQVGWYHSHPGYGPYLSGIDVGTQRGLQMQGPYVAVVIDPIRTATTGKIDIGAFRTYPEGQAPRQNQSNTTADGVPEDKILDFGKWHTEYYQLDIEYFVSSADLPIVESLCSRLWINGLKKDEMNDNKKYFTEKLTDMTHKAKKIAAQLNTPSDQGGRTNKGQLTSFLKFSKDLSHNVHQECAKVLSFNK